MSNSQHSNQKTKRSWWATLPGILTGTAAVITALGTLIAALSGMLKSGPSSSKLASLEASRDFVVGRWQVEQTVGLVTGESVRSVSGGSEVTYQDDGKFIGSLRINETGQKRLVAGHWDFARLSKDTFRLKVQFDDQTIWLGVFQIVDQDRIHNIEQNYDALRMK